MQVIDPTGVPREEKARSEPWRLNVRGSTLGFLSNGKPNAENLLRAIDRRLRERFGTGPSIWADKSREARGFGWPATEEIYQRLTSGAVAVLGASGD